MKITFLCSDTNHPVIPYLQSWIKTNEQQHDITLTSQAEQLTHGDILFLVSCSEYIADRSRAKYQLTLVLHASDLPKGRGWSPHIWQIIEGVNTITLSLIAAESRIDEGDIFAQSTFNITKDMLWDEINHCLFKAELELIDHAVTHYISLKPRPQSSEITSSYYPKRTPADSEIDPGKSIAEQFNQIRVSDPNRFPAFFKLHGRTYKLILEKIDEE